MIHIEIRTTGMFISNLKEMYTFEFEFSGFKNGININKRMVNIKE